LLDAMQAGALAILDKPGCCAVRAEFAPSVIWNIRAAMSANLILHSEENITPVESTHATSMLAIGAGMGGLPALTRILSQLPGDAPGAVVVSPLPSHVMAEYAGRLNQRCKVFVKLAGDGDSIQAGRVLLARGDSHLLLRRSAQGFSVCVKDGPAVFHQKPSIEILFNSIAEIAGGEAVGVLLGGAGVDGIAGLMRLRNRGGRTIAESEQSCVIADAPLRAKKCGAVEEMVPANEIARKMMEFAVRSSSRAA
jgi:two-component system chemotaxis response regulator CheB